MRTYQTWEVVKALMEHGDWRGEAEKNTKTGNACERLRRFGDGSGFEPMSKLGGKWLSIDCLGNRSDWRLYDASGNEVTDYE